MERVGAGAVGAKAVEGRNAERRREVAVGSAAGRAFGKLPAESARDARGALVECGDAGRSLHRRTIDAAAHAQTSRAGSSRDERW